MHRVPRLCCHGEQIFAGRKIAHLVGAGIVSQWLRLPGRCARPLREASAA